LKNEHAHSGDKMPHDHQLHDQEHEGGDGKHHNTNDHGPNPFKYVIALLDEHSKSLSRRNELEEQKIRKGETYHINMTLGATDATSRPVYVDFVRGTNSHDGSTNLPADSTNDFPFSKVYKITIKNTGSANINYAVGRKGSLSFPGILLTGTERTFECLYKVYAGINLARAANSGSSTAAIELILEV